MMKFLNRKTVSESKLKKGLIYRLEKVSETEILRWSDNIHTGLGMNVQELRKSLTRGDKDQALVYINDMRTGAISLLASMEVLGTRLDPNWKTDL
jgi:hypothetical protein